MAAQTATVHASCVLVGARAVLIRGPSGSGKSRLALDLIRAAESAALRFARLVADDRAHLASAGGRLLARPSEQLAGLIEVRGIGLLRLAYEPCAVVGLIVDLGAEDASRLPDPHAQQTVIEGISLPRLAVASAAAPLPMVISLLNSCQDGWLDRLPTPGLGIG